MTKKAVQNLNGTGDAPDDIESTYHELLQAFYEEEDREQARKIADRLEAALAARPDFADSIRAEEIRSLIAELRGDFAEAVYRRESEVRKIFELHSMAVNTPSWESVFRQYDYSDVSDRLDLLADLYADQGKLTRAVELLHESRRFCEAHGIPFDGQDLLDEYEQAGRASNGRTAPTTVPRDVLDKAVRAAFRDFDAEADGILVDDEKSRRFAAEVNRRLPDRLLASIKDIKTRLLVLRKQGRRREGLPPQRN